MPSSYTPGGGTFNPASPGPIIGSTGDFTALSVGTVSLADYMGTLLVNGGYGQVRCATLNAWGINTLWAAINSGGHDGWSTVGGNGEIGVSNQVWLSSPSANTLALRNSTAGQTLLLSRSFTDASNYSQVKIDVTGSTVAFSADEAGTGAGTLTGYSFDKPLGLSSVVIAGTQYYPHDTAGTLTWTTTP